MIFLHPFRYLFLFSKSSVSSVAILLSLQFFHSVRYLFLSFQLLRFFCYYLTFVSSIPLYWLPLLFISSLSCRSLRPSYPSFCFNSLLVLDSTASNVKHQAGASAREDPATERSMKRARNCKRISQSVASSAWNSVRKILDPSNKRAGKCKERS